MDAQTILSGLVSTLFTMTAVEVGLAFLMRGAKEATPDD
jgi:hypothetical protein